jgi:hypothetical protein
MTVTLFFFTQSSYWFASRFFVRLRFFLSSLHFFPPSQVCVLHVRNVRARKLLHSLSSPLVRLREFIAHSMREYPFWHLDLFPKPTLYALSYCRLSYGLDRLGAYHL